MDHDNDELNPWGEELKLPIETISEIAGMLHRLADSGRCTQESPEGVFSSSSNCLATWVSRLADRIRAAQERERRAYERLHKCFWDKRTIQCIVRQMRDDADDLRHAFPNASEELDHFADSIAKSAKNCPNSGPKIGQLDACALDKVTKGEKVSTSQEPGDGVTESLTGIVRDLRDCANRVEEDYHDEDVWDSSEAAWIYRDIADRIEAAHKREKAVTDALLACKDKMTPHPDPDHVPPPYPGDAIVPRDTHGATGEGWYGFDLDGTLARYDGWKGIDHIGEPISAMVALIKRLHAEGKIVKIMTARVAPRDDTIDGHDARYYVCEWCAKHLGFTPDVVFQKDTRMLELYDDRVKQVVPNTGILVENLAGCGNASALRKALEDTEELLEHFAKPGTMLHGAFYLHMRDNRAALAGPARNCDIYDAENGAAECMQAIDAAWYEIDTIRATIGWMLASVEDSLKKEEGAE